MKLIGLLLLLIAYVSAAPWLDQLFAGYNQQRQYNNAEGPRHREPKSGGKERWKEICRTINPGYTACPW